mmetsp:Transcript_100413/g.139575  ORF Transcript_100413/g.139575 Transcript_100413/m.139575 type:complete len:204 (+) Transcript_100413:27-638(+)
MNQSMSEEEINGRTGSDKLFPGKLHDLLDYAEREGLEHIVSWSQDGHSFAIHKPKALVDILPMFFGHSRYRSFHRQLNMWSYRRLLEGPNKGFFTHPFFVRGQKAQCRTISRHRFRSIPLEMDSTKLARHSSVAAAHVNSRQAATTAIERRPSQVSVDSDDETSQELNETLPTSGSGVLFRDGDLLSFEGKTFHFVGCDLDLF